MSMKQFLFTVTCLYFVVLISFSGLSQSDSIYFTDKKLTTGTDTTSSTIQSFYATYENYRYEVSAEVNGGAPQIYSYSKLLLMADSTDALWSKPASTILFSKNEIKSVSFFDENDSTIFYIEFTTKGKVSRIVEGKFYIENGILMKRLIRISRYNNKGIIELEEYSPNGYLCRILYFRFNGKLKSIDYLDPIGVRIIKRESYDRRGVLISSFQIAQ